MMDTDYGEVRRALREWELADDAYPIKAARALRVIGDAAPAMLDEITSLRSELEDIRSELRARDGRGWRGDGALDMRNFSASWERCEATIREAVLSRPSDIGRLVMFRLVQLNRSDLQLIVDAPPRCFVEWMER